MHKDVVISQFDCFPCDTRDNPKNWYAVYLRSKCEFISKLELLKKGIDVFLPTVKLLRQWKDRRKEMDFPLFPGYLFVHIQENIEARVQVLKTRGVVCLLSSSSGSPIPVPSSEIKNLVLVTRGERQLDVYTHLKEGHRVRVCRGPLEGAEGILHKKCANNTCLFVVNVEILGRCVGINIHADDIEPA